MKNLLSYLIIALLVACSASKQGSLSKSGKELQNNLRLHVQYLADDKLEGRRTGTQGEVLAMRYIAARFDKAGLEPKGTNGFIQEFTIEEGKTYDSSSVELLVNDKSLKVRTDFFPLPYSANATLNTQGSPALREKGEAWFLDVAELLEDNKTNPHFDIHSEIKKAADKNARKGATALIVYNSGNKVDNIQFSRFDTSASLPIPVLYITAKGKKAYMGDATATYYLTIKTNLVNTSRQARNVVGFINNNAKNTVIIGAHYDHLGYGEDQNSLDGHGHIHNGADDNASGVAGLIELAAMLKKSDLHANNYLFIAFSGEELGLKGSKYWLDNPTVSISPNYMINMDMIGRYDSSRKLTIGGYGTSPTWGAIFTPSLYQPLVVKFDSSGVAPSDNASFYRKDIPVLFFFTNSHSDYHKASDDADKINYEGQTRIVMLAYNVIEKANNQGKLSFLKTSEPQMARASFSVSLGVMPDYGYTGTGMRIDGVSKGRLAEKIGLQAGDVLLQLGEYKFVDVQSYMQVLGKFKKGDRTKLTISRNGKQMQFDLEF